MRWKFATRAVGPSLRSFTIPACTLGFSLYVFNRNFYKNSSAPHGIQELQCVYLALTDSITFFSFKSRNVWKPLLTASSSKSNSYFTIKFLTECFLSWKNVEVMEVRETVRKKEGSKKSLQLSILLTCLSNSEQNTQESGLNRSSKVSKFTRK